MINSISFATNIEELLSVQELSDIFDSVISANETNPTVFSLLRQLEKIKKKAIEKAVIQRSFELSKLKSVIVARKMKIQLEIWKNKNALKQLCGKIQNTDLKQEIYELEQITNVLEDTINSLTSKNIQIEECMKSQEKGASRYKVKQKNNLKEQYEELLLAINYLSRKHDNFLKSLEVELKDLLKIITDTSIELTDYNSNKLPIQNIVINTANDMQPHFDKQNMNIKREYYLYEPDFNNLDDQLIYLLLRQNDYNGTNGKINDLEMFNDEGE